MGISDERYRPNVPSDWSFTFFFCFSLVQFASADFRGQVSACQD
ncbi:Conserved hypothetical protein [Prochlorococcus marinus str. MIT 9313]|uniref:Uncharacterized protein n=1 Tax=Prochlorococcus marinus (strain MIT 9313) TaxID=74547 RepID=B9ESM7_PROMM|nr:Conserved hypothetical protein [Prochlorococcus marinus str. MIT 9313]